jgi:hypothetical protein
MIPISETEKFLRDEIASVVRGVQVVTAREQAELVLPRIVIAGSIEPDPTLAQADVFPIEVEVTILADAREPADISPLVSIVSQKILGADRVTSCVRALGNEFVTEDVTGNDFVAIYGSVLVASSFSESDERLSATITGTLWARLKNQ